MQEERWENKQTQKVFLFYALISPLFSPSLVNLLFLRNLNFPKSCSTSQLRISNLVVKTYSSFIHLFIYLFIFFVSIL